MPKEKDKRKESPEITEENEDKKDDVEDERADLKSKIKDNLKRAIDFQTEIKELTGKTLEGLERMDDLSKMLEELYHKAEEKVESLEKDLEEKTTVPEGDKSEEEGVNFEQLLSKAKEIKEMLRRPGEIEPGGLEEEKVEEEGAPEEPVEEAPEEEISPLEAMDETIKMKPGEEVEMEPVPEEKEEPGIEEAKAEEAPVAGEEPEKDISPLDALDATIKIKPKEKLEKGAGQEEKRGAGGEVADVSGFPKRRASDALEILERYKKAEPEEEAEVVYYENDKNPARFPNIP
jgi:pilus assembly protein FimV